MSAFLKKIECDPECGFMIRSHDERELVDITKLHVKNQHRKDVSDDSLKNMISPV